VITYWTLVKKTLAWTAAAAATARTALNFMIAVGETSDGMD
jgi:hypothetical protein